MMFTAQEMNDESKTFLDYIHRQLIPFRFESLNLGNLWIARRVKATTAILVAIKKSKNETIPAHVYANLREFYFEIKKKNKVPSRINQK
ncbi:unnamed protein product [Commensalibacter communis]|uniref:hypothetical protein n=1 Tax=Commensalibacter communis TaxID=2972786 RepID=UPI0022FFAB80|nr:hypothetical protein [Commensalibacter communis]CAI3951184.1 unnamed protein product [Commensalibacter communis]